MFNCSICGGDRHVRRQDYLVDGDVEVVYICSDCVESIESMTIVDLDELETREWEHEEADCRRSERARFTVEGFGEDGED